MSRFVPAWERDRRRALAKARAQRTQEQRALRFEHSAEIELLDRSIVTLREALRQEAIDRLEGRTR